MANVNGFDPGPWAVDGSRVRAATMRMALASAAGKAEGIVSPADCKVSPLSTPGAGISIAPGSILIRNRSAGVRDQTYAVRAPLPSTWDGPAASGSARSYLVLVRVVDPEYSPWTLPQGADASTYQYTQIHLEPCPANTTSVSQLNLSYSAYALARLDIPANTTTITAAMIKDLRKVALPRRERRVALYSPPASDPPIVFGPVSGSTSPWQWLPRTNELIDCPEWATQLKMIVSVGNLLHIGDLAGQIRGEYGWNGSGQLVTDPAGLHHADSTVGARTRMHVTTASEMAVPASFRGKSHYVRTGTILHPATGRLEVDQWTNVVVDLEFVEVPE